MIAPTPLPPPSQFKLPLCHHLASFKLQVPSELDRMRGGFQLFFKIILKCQWQSKNAAPTSRICMLRSAGRGRRERECGWLLSPSFVSGNCIWELGCVRKKKARDGMGWSKRGNIRVRLTPRGLRVPRSAIDGICGGLLVWPHEDGDMEIQMWYIFSKSFGSFRCYGRWRLFKCIFASRAYFQWSQSAKIFEGNLQQFAAGRHIDSQGSHWRFVGTSQTDFHNVNL